MVIIATEHIATGGNRHAAAADWDHDGSGLLAYGADCNIAVWKPYDRDRKGVHSLLCGHGDNVNAVKFFKPVKSANQKVVILSGSSDHTFRVWIDDPQSPNGFKEAAVVEECRSSINAVATLPGSNIVVSSSADAQVRLWRFTLDEEKLSAQLKLVQTISLKPHYFPLALDLAPLGSEGSIVLATAGTKSFIQVFVSPSAENPDFKLATLLTGHEGWIRSLAFVQKKENTSDGLILASASQDKYIRLWRIQKGEATPTRDQVSTDPLMGVLKNSLSNKAYRFTSRDSSYSVTFEALLIGHEDWIYTAKWHHGEDNGLRLLSASADNSLAVWEPDPNSGIWICTARLGEINAAKGATTATGSSGGFWIGLWAPDGKAVASLGRTGSWRLWQHEADDDSWRPGVGVAGHTRSVRALAWARDGSYLLSTGADQTTRLLSQWRKNGTSSWHEFSRPQVHGYDLNCLDVLSDSRFISGADEKPLRVFEKPKAVSDLLTGFSGLESIKAGSQSLPAAASIPIMGLSNKAIDTSTADTDDECFEYHTNDTDEAEEAVISAATRLTTSTMSASQQPPVEDHLGRHLLWPEIEKLYGHGYEICAIACSHDGTLVATACRASSIDHAVIRLYETEGWLELKPPLKAHGLTVTALGFDQTDEFLISVGRDRMCVVWRRAHLDRNQFTMLLQMEKAHTRMVLDASWAPTTPLNVLRDFPLSRTPRQCIFATAGRDKNVQIWSIAVPSSRNAIKTETQQSHRGHTEGSERAEDSYPSVMTRLASIIASTAVTSIAFAPYQSPFPKASTDSDTDGTDHNDNGRQQTIHLAFGLEDGNIAIARLSVTWPPIDDHAHPMLHTATSGDGHTDSNSDRAMLRVESVEYLDRRISPSKAVNALAWQPRHCPSKHEEKEGNRARDSSKGLCMKLAAASEDSAIIIYDVRI
ncbi:MAG: hypothetical protein M1831_006294 [Alyxoria varia]|nr:MAG: hypothetical protein M1831_006294 [Alyxoria varia]